MDRHTGLGWPRSPQEPEGIEPADTSGLGWPENKEDQ